MTLEEKINRLREATEKYRKNTNAEPQNSFEAEAKKVAKHEAEKNKQLADWLEELKRYRDLEEQGRLLVLPCKVGDTVYEILEETVPNHHFYINEWKVQDVSTQSIKYDGSVADNFGKGFVQAIPTLEKCLDKYKETGNTEYLCDLANYAMFEFMYPQHPKGHFRATDSRESAGIVGLSVNEAKGIKSW